MNDTTTASPPTAPRRRKSHGGLIFAIVVVLAAGGWYGWHKYKANANKEGEYLTATVTTGSIEDLVTSTGTLQPRDYVDVGAQVSGQIEDLFVEVGDSVKKGQELAKIDATTSEARVEAQKAQLESAKNTLLSQIESLEKAKRDFDRQTNLFAQDATTKQAVLDAQTTYENAKRSKVNSELSIKQQEATMRIDAKNLAYTSIVAPIDGTVMSIAVKLGQTVNATQNVPNVMRIANLETMTVQSEVSEADISKLYTGIPVYFTTLGGNSKRWQGNLKRIEPTPKVQNSVVLYNALFDVQNDGNTLMPSMTAQVFFISAQARDVLIVPMAALQQGQQIAREQAKEKEKNAAAKTAGAPGASTPTAAGTRDGTGAPAPATTGPAAPAAAAPGDVAANGDPANRRGGGAQGNRPGGGQGLRAGQPGGGFGGQRGGGTGEPGANGQRRGFNPQNMSPEQIEQFRRMREQGGGGFGGPRPGGDVARGAGAGGAPRAVQQRRGTVAVKKADGTLELRQVVVGVNDRVLGQVLSGLKEGEEVVVGRRESEAAAAARPANANQNFNQNRGAQGGFSGGGGGGFQGGGGRPF
ncbi:MAG: efflux RND transporter periplasmic adaptor subunit [Steroidobacteraceae bacterium]